MNRPRCEPALLDGRDRDGITIDVCQDYRELSWPHARRGVFDLAKAQTREPPEG